ncbi:MAG: hypothetical protein IH851_08850 [Armatimonadetes bacterium]|nr:hypothetical protein [Armatimonadota bacterium]
MTPLYISLSALTAILVMSFLLALFWTRKWPLGKTEARLKGLALPQGSIRGLIAVFVIGAFFIFLLFGKDALSTEQVTGFDDIGTGLTREDTALFDTARASFAALAGAVVAFGLDALRAALLRRSP